MEHTGRGVQTLILVIIEGQSLRSGAIPYISEIVANLVSITELQSVFDVPGSTGFFDCVLGETSFETSSGSLGK